MTAFPEKLAEKLAQRKADQAFRTLLLGQGVDFYSNDYLGASRIPHESLQNHGSTGSRLISGNSEFTENIEKRLAHFFGSEAALLFNSGYDANLGLLAAVPQRGDTVIYDALVHASIRDGIRLGSAKSFGFAHNNLEDLKDKLSRAEGDKYVVVESVYSMDGDQAPLEEVVSICKDAGAFLIVDEAHAGGLFGESGEGLVSQLGLNEDVFAKVVTYGKAYGSHGAVVLGSSDLRDFLINFARSLIYTTAISPAAQHRIELMTFHVAEMKAERERLFRLIDQFKEQMKGSKLRVVPSDSPIQSVLVRGNARSQELARELVKEGFMVKAILSPTVPEGFERIRICLHAFNTPEEVTELVKVLNNG